MCQTLWRSVHGSLPRWYVDQTAHDRLSPSLRFNGHFPSGPGLADTRMSPFWIFVGAKADGHGGVNWHAKLQSNHYHQQTNTQLFKGRCPSSRPTNSVRSLNVNLIRQSTSVKYADIKDPAFIVWQQRQFLPRPFVQC